MTEHSLSFRMKSSSRLVGGASLENTEALTLELVSHVSLFGPVARVRTYLSAGNSFNAERSAPGVLTAMVSKSMAPFPGALFLLDCFSTLGETPAGMDMDVVPVGGRRTPCFPLGSPDGVWSSFCSTEK